MEIVKNLRDGIPTGKRAVTVGSSVPLDEIGYDGPSVTKECFDCGEPCYLPLAALGELDDLDALFGCSNCFIAKLREGVIDLDKAVITERDLDKIKELGDDRFDGMDNQGVKETLEFMLHEIKVGVD